MKRKLGIGLLLVAVVVGLFALFGRTWLAERAFQRALDTTVGVDASASLPDGLNVYVCGSGSPMPDASRAGPCIAVLAGNQAFVFDAGSGSIRKLMRMGFPMPRMQAAFLTHLHSDHIDGLGELLLQAWVGGHRGTPLPVYGPAGTDKVVAGFNAAYQIDAGYRVAHHGPKVVQPSGFGGAAQIIALPDGTDSQVVYDQGGVRITVIRVNHAPIAPAFGYRIDYKGRAVALSGDTVYAPSFVAAAKGADLMLHEALNKKMIAALGAKLAERGQANNAQIMHDIQNYHASPEDAARAAKEAGVQALVLYHLVPAPPARLIDPLFLGDAPKVFTGTLKLAQDGMMISLPAGSKAVNFFSAF
ncbi:MAG: MBL fold metallo-hydrolase [Novosphingobium sp.]